MTLELDVTEARAGIRDMRERLQSLLRGSQAAIGRALVAEAEVEMALMIARTPMEHGDLRGSYRVVGPIFERGTVSVLIVCGGPKAPYAWYVHENLEEFHKVGQSKFMESVINEAKRHHAAHVGARVGSELSRLVRP